MSEEELSRVYTINLSRVWLTPRIRRTKRAINMIREFAQRHMKSDDVMIDQTLNEAMWKRGIRKPPRKIRVKMVKDEDDLVTVSLYTEEVKEEAKAVEEEKKAVVSPNAMATAVPAVEEMEAKAEETKLLATAKVEEPTQEVKEEKVTRKKAKEPEPEKIELSEEELAEILTEETQGLEIKEEKSKKDKDKGKKSKSREDSEE